MGESAEEEVLDLVMVRTKGASDAEVWGFEVASILLDSSASVSLSLPSVELTRLLVSHLLHSDDSPLPWKLIDKALSLNIIHPLLLLALLSNTNTLLPSRHLRPAPYTLYLQLLNRYAFSTLFFVSHINSTHYQQYVHRLISID